MSDYTLPHLYGEGEHEFESILEALDVNRVFSFEYENDKVLLIDGCDMCFSLPLNKSQLLILADEISRLAEGL